MFRFWTWECLLQCVLQRVSKEFLETRRDFEANMLYQDSTDKIRPWRPVLRFIVVRYINNILASEIVHPYCKSLLRLCPGKVIQRFSPFRVDNIDEVLKLHFSMLPFCWLLTDDPLHLTSNMELVATSSWIVFSCCTQNEVRDQCQVYLPNNRLPRRLYRFKNFSQLYTVYYITYIPMRRYSMSHMIWAIQYWP